MPADVAQRLLHDTVGRGADRHRQRRQSIAGCVRDVEAVGTHACDELVDAVEPDLGLQRRTLSVVGVATQEAEDHAELVEHLATGAADRLERRLQLRRIDSIGPVGEQVGGRAGLDVDRRHRVGDAVVQVLGDSQPLVGDSLPIGKAATFTLADDAIAAGGDELPGQHRRQRPPDCRQRQTIAATVADRQPQRHGSPHEQGARPRHRALDPQPEQDE